MEPSEIQPARTDVMESRPALTNRWSRIGLLRVHTRGLQVKLIVPYLLLTVVLAALGIFVTISLTVDSERERFNNRLLEASRVANDGFVNYEKVQLDRLRFLIFSDGMAQAIFDQQPDLIYNLMRP